MSSRLDLQKMLETLLGSKQVYYQKPENVKIQYPAIIYSKSKIDTKKADDTIYKKDTKYSITIIDHKPDNVVIDKLLVLPYCSYERNYKVDNLNHDVLNIYY